MKYYEFLHIAGLFIDRLHVKPLLFGSLGLEIRLGVSLNADDIDILIPKRYLYAVWSKVMDLMIADGYALSNAEEHEFVKGSIRVAYAAIEDLKPFAGVDITSIPEVRDDGVIYLLLELPEYLKVYEASSKDGYRRDVKNKQDQKKIELIQRAMNNDQKM